MLHSTVPPARASVLARSHRKKCTPVKCWAGQILWPGDSYGRGRRRGGGLGICLKIPCLWLPGRLESIATRRGGRQGRRWGWGGSRTWGGEDEEEVKQAVAMSIPQRNLCLMVVCCVPVVFYVPVWQVPHRGPWFGCSFSCVQLNAATALGRHASSRYIVDIVVSNRLLARSVLGFLLCFLGRRGLSCPKVINEHTYAQSLFAGGGTFGPLPPYKDLALQGDLAPLRPRWLNHLCLTL